MNEHIGDTWLSTNTREEEYQATFEDAIEWGSHHDEIVFGELTKEELLDEYKNHMIAQEDNAIDMRIDEMRGR